VRLGLANLMIGIYSVDGDIEAAFDWSASGFTAAATPEQNKALAGVTVEYLGRADEGTLRKLYKKKLSDFMRAFLDFRYADIEMQKGQDDMARERLKTILAQNPDHPLVPKIQTALRGTVVAKPATGAGPRSEIPLNADRVGVLVPLNGPNAKYGDMVVRGLNMAISDWNERFPDQKVTLVIKDAGTEQETATASFEELSKKEGVLAVIGLLARRRQRE